MKSKNLNLFLQVAKNRFDGCKGCILLDYDEKTLTYTMKKMSTKAKSATGNSSVI